MKTFAPIAMSARAVALATTLLACGMAAAQDAGALRQRHDALREQLAASPFGRPLVLESGPSKGEVWAIVDHPFSVTGPALQDRKAWCDLLVLPFNVKQCELAGDGIGLLVGRKSEQPLEDAYRLDFSYSSKLDTDALHVQMAADSGPVGTKDYRLNFDAVPLDARRSFVHMSYSYGYGTTAKMATQAYLATAGRNKVGFTVTGKDADGKPVYVDGLRGIAERNAMRYYLAIESYLGTLQTPAAQRRDKRLREWFDANERHARQLHEMERDEYLTLKRGDLQAQR